MYTLKDVPIGEAVSVVKLYASGAIKRRIMDMGITRHCKIYVRKVAPLGDPIELNLRGYELTLRKEDAALIEVKDIVHSAVAAFKAPLVQENKGDKSCH